MTHARRADGFTLIELAIVLVIIGLLTAGVLVGRDMIHSAEIRAAYGQIEQYRTAVNVFRAKYGGMPGDLIARRARDFGFATRDGVTGGNGNDRIEGCLPSTAPTSGCEARLFWRDLSQARLITQGFSTAQNDEALIDVPDVGLYFPESRLGRQNSVLAAFGWHPAGAWSPIEYPCQEGRNYFYLARIVQAGPIAGFYTLRATIPPVTAVSMDLKFDNGQPVTGDVLAGAANFPCINFGPGPTGCTVADGSAYNMALEDDPLCQMAIRF